jgi:hypothetical protein
MVLLQEPLFQRGCTENRLVQGDAGRDQQRVDLVGGLQPDTMHRQLLAARPRFDPVARHGQHLSGAHTP